MASIIKRRNRNHTTSYIAVVRIKGFKPTAKSFVDREDAKQWSTDLERQLREQRSRGGLRQDVTALTVRDLIREFEQDPVNSGRKSAGDTTALLTWWLDNYGTVRALEVNVLTLRDARERLLSSGARKRKLAGGTLVVAKRSASTVNRHLSAMRACWNWARRSGLVPMGNIWPTGLQLTEPRGRARFLSDQELTRLMRAAEAAGPALNAAVVVSVATGLRQGELLRLTWADIDLEQGSLRVMESKTDTPRAVHLAAPAVAALRALRARPVVGFDRVFVLDDGTALDRSLLTSRWKSIRRNAGLTDARWHDLRHCCASFLLQAGATLAEVGSVLGHRSPSVTARYAHLIVGRPLAAHSGLASKLTAAMSVPRTTENAT
jgi:integrase